MSLVFAPLSNVALTRADCRIDLGIDGEWLA